MPSPAQLAALRAVYAEQVTIAIRKIIPLGVFLTQATVADKATVGRKGKLQDRFQEGANDNSRPDPPRS